MSNFLKSKKVGAKNYHKKSEMYEGQFGLQMTEKVVILQGSYFNIFNFR